MSISSTTSCTSADQSASDFHARRSDGWESEPELDTQLARQKHADFERRRQKHYQMKDELRKGKELALHELTDEE